MIKEICRWRTKDCFRKMALWDEYIECLYIITTDDNCKSNPKTEIIDDIKNQAQILLEEIICDYDCLISIEEDQLVLFRDDIDYLREQYPYTDKVIVDLMIGGAKLHD